MTKQRLYIVIGAVLVLVAIGVFVAVMYLSNKAPEGSDPATGSTNPFGQMLTPGGVSGTGTGTVTISTESGESVQVPDFKKGREPLTTPNGNYYNLYGPEYSTEGFTFSVQYGEMDSQFLVMLISEPIGSARTDAEAYLRNLLSLSDQELCELNIDISVTPDVNEAYSQYSDLGLSFCRGSVTLP